MTPLPVAPSSYWDLSVHGESSICEHEATQPGDQLEAASALSGTHAWYATRDHKPDTSESSAMAVAVWGRLDYPTKRYGGCERWKSLSAAID